MFGVCIDVVCLCTLVGDYAASREQEDANVGRNPVEVELYGPPVHEES